MKTIKQIISDADPRLKGVLMIMIVYVMVMATTVTSGATQEIKGYKETIEIQYQDGSQEAKDYLVRQDTVKNVLKELDVNLGTKDTVNKDMAYIVQSKDLLQVNRISEEEVEEIQYVDSQTIGCCCCSAILTSLTARSAFTICRCRFCSSTAGAPGWRWSIRRHFYSPIPSPIISRWENRTRRRRRLSGLLNWPACMTTFCVCLRATRPKWASAA